MVEVHEEPQAGGRVGETTDAALEALAMELGEAMQAAGLMLVTAESCTGGWVGQVATSVPGSSKWFERGFITYTNQAKREMLDVPTEVLARYGAVSIQCARAMVAGALTKSHAQVALAITGIAGPGGGSEEKPVGTVCFAWQHTGDEPVTAQHHFEGDRAAVRRQAVAQALKGALGLAAAG